MIKKDVWYDKAMKGTSGLAFTDYFMFWTFRANSGLQPFQKYRSLLTISHFFLTIFPLSLFYLCFLKHFTKTISEKETGREKTL